MGLVVANTNYSYSLNNVVIELIQSNNTGGADNSDYPNGWYGSAARFSVHTNGVGAQTTPLNGSMTSSGGGVYLPLCGGTHIPAAPETICATNGVLGLNYATSGNTLTGYFNGTPVGSFSLPGWGTNPPLILAVLGGSGEGVGAPAGTVTATNFSLAFTLSVIL